MADDPAQCFLGSGRLPRTLPSPWEAQAGSELIGPASGVTPLALDCRRRIRICCDELNLLVPFCNAETDKATTLQWTTAFLKYIQERHGDSLKKVSARPGCGPSASVRLLASGTDPHVNTPLMGQAAGHVGSVGSAGAAAVCRGPDGCAVQSLSSEKPPES